MVFFDPSECPVRDKLSTTVLKSIPTMDLIDTSALKIFYRYLRNHLALEIFFARKMRQSLFYPKTEKLLLSVTHSILVRDKNGPSAKREILNTHKKIAKPTRF